MIFDLSDWKQWWEWIRPALHISLIWFMGAAALWAIRRLLRLLKAHIVRRSDQSFDARRIETLMNVFRYTANIVIFGVAVLLTLGTIGISVTPILATAGVAGIAIGFGAQSLVKDFFTGLFLLIENQVSEGDVIEAAGKSGYVERVTLRHIRIRDYDGSVHFIPNSMITTVTNRSRGYAYAVIDINVRREEDLDRVFEMMHTIAVAMRADATIGPAILDDIDIAGVEKVEDAVVGVRCRFKVWPAKQWRVRREFLRRMKAAMDSAATWSPPPD
ncbi:MAG TPA: mechanosensitive ion channel family protein [Noviherbaspirillum sp.]|nr:mechanosensitive ion channel family protein [Noviherbaspirillum sp.]